MKKMLMFALLTSMSCLSQAATLTPAQRMTKAIDAMGGGNLAQVKTLTLKARTKHWDPEQSNEAGGEMRFAGDSTFTQYRDFSVPAVRIEWQRKHAYPAPREYTFTEMLTGETGMVIGVDATTRTKQSLESKPPQHVMSGIRVATALRELRRASPLLLLEMAQAPQRVSALPDQKIGGQSLPALRYQSATGTFIVMFDPSTSLPLRIRTLDYDSILGDSTYDLVLADWRAAGAIQYPYLQTNQFNGRSVIETRIDEARVNAPVDAALLAIPDGIRATAPKLAVGDVPYQWVLRRQYIGVFLDSDAIAWDPQASGGLKLVDVGPGIAHFTGGSHNSLFVEMDKYLVVFDAPMGDFYSRLAMDAAAKRFPGKPVKYLVLTHHHMDHASGVRAYAAAGVTVVVGKGNGAHFRKGLSASATLATDSPKNRFKPEVVEASDRWIISDGKREVHAYRTDNPHAASMMIGYIPDAKLGFVTDLWSPARDVLGARLNGGQAAVVSVVRRWGLTPDRFAGGHGAVAPYADLDRLAQN